MYSKYNHSHRCPRCRITLEYIYTKDYVDEFYCPECKVSEYRTLEAWNYEKRLSDRLGK